MSWRKARRDRRAGQADVRLGAPTNQQKDIKTSSCVQYMSISHRITL